MYRPVKLLITKCIYRILPKSPKLVVSRVIRLPGRYFQSEVISLKIIQPSGAISRLLDKWRLGNLRQLDILKSKLVNFNMNISENGTRIMPPENVRGMQQLDKDAFKTTVQVPSVKVPSKSVGKLIREMKSRLLTVFKIKSIVSSKSPLHKVLLFNPIVIKAPTDFSEKDLKLFEECGVDLHSFQFYELELGYDNFSFPQVMQAILPVVEDGQYVSSFSATGHIAHLNLKDHFLERKYLIGQVLLDKNPSIKTVVNKVNQIDSTYRNFQMELIGGEDNFITRAKENGFIYKFDLSKVYWNSKLGTEHERIVETVKEGDILYDAFAGVGPFSVPAAAKKVTVLANDLNPESYKSLNANIKINKCKGDIKTFNVDARQFITETVKPHITEQLSTHIDKNHALKTALVMNLPAIAVEFLDCFRGLLTGLPLEMRSSEFFKRPHLFCYCFSKGDTPFAEIKDRVKKAMGFPVPSDTSIRLVRNVAPSKNMYCISFDLPDEVLFYDESTTKSAEEGDDIGEPESKKLRLEEKS